VTDEPRGRRGWIGFERWFWNISSSVWDTVRNGESPSEIETKVQWLAGHRSHEGERALDVGCGTGNYTMALANAGYQAIGVDFAPRMLERAQGKARRLPPGTVTFDLTDFNAGLPFPDGSFDVVVSSLVIHHLPDEARLPAVKEMKRVLRAGGRLLLADFTIPERGFWHVLGAVTGHSSAQRAMMQRTSPLEPLVGAAGFTELRSGDTPPWLHYVGASKP
jgi:ubiquinone/menaquinone biosynthesis C-methylase UbiE